MDGMFRLFTTYDNFQHLLYRLQLVRFLWENKKVDGQVLIDLPFHQLLLKSYFFISA